MLCRKTANTLLQFDAIVLGSAGYNSIKIDFNHTRLLHFSGPFLSKMDNLHTFTQEFDFFNKNLTIMITFFFVGSLFGAALMGVYGALKYFSYKEEVTHLKETIQRLEILNSDLIYNTFHDARNE